MEGVLSNGFTFKAIGSPIQGINPNPTALCGTHYTIYCSAQKP